MNEKWLTKMEFEMAAQFDVLDDVRRTPTIVLKEIEIKKSRNRIFRYTFN